ncbi:outer membrane protein assembly factor BamA [Rhizosaccharibacter radicis]|uniref:Outer membrane protein assembly factor BamA n=1 Tax=Rhizosaccharibacter radicis TaxID=2782605 RepID=A0ABT1VVB5_9PROT|nr:outer membrane protein assembly factor BamA [Acetobacteraceae bacterium KSS12]
MSGNRYALLASVCLVPFAADAASAQTTDRAAHRPSSHRSQTVRRASASAPATGGVIQSIQVQGNERIETGTILSYLVVRPGDPFAQDQLDRSLKTLYATGLFRDVTLHREGGTLVVKVVENPIVNRIAFEGNHAAKDDDLIKVISLRARAVYTPEMASRDRQKILQVYAEKGRYNVSVTPQIIRLSHNRVDVIFQINEGTLTLIKKVAFVGNKAFSEARLAQVITSKETAWYRFFSSSDEYNPDRVKYDSELLRRFYLRNGYVDFQVVDATAELAPDRKNFFVTFTVDEGARYRIGHIEVKSSLRHVTAESLRPLIKIYEHQWYNGDDIQQTAEALQTRLQGSGEPFAQVKPEIARNTDNHTVDLLFDVSEGPHVYVDRIDIAGNTITQDRVIRRQFDMAEGDPYTPQQQRRAKQSLEDLGFFNSVTVDTARGAAPDRVVVNTGLTEKPTGQLTLGGGYSTDAGILGNAGIRQSNLLGTGIDASLQGTVGQYQNQVDLSVTDPYFLGRNLVAGADLFYLDSSNQAIANYYETRVGATARIGYAYNRYLSQSWNYSIVHRSVGDINSGASVYIQAEDGRSLLSQIGTTLALDHRDSRLQPHDGYLISVGGDFAGIGGDEKYVRGKIDGSYYIPLDYFTGNHDWTVSLRAGTGYISDFGGGRQDVVDNFYLGGDNLRGFYDGGVGPHSRITDKYNVSDALGGRFIYTGSAQVNFPLPVGPDLGLSGRYFVDMGGLSGARVLSRNYFSRDPQAAIVQNNLTPRVSTGVGVSWKSPFGLINVDIGIPIVKQDQDTQQVFRFGFGSQF